MNTSSKQSVTSTILGMIAILFWSTTIAFIRKLAEQIGPLTSSGYAMLIGGVIGLLFIAVVQRKFRELLSLPRAYLFGGLILVVVYLVCISLAIGRPMDNQVVLEAGLVNYLWPGLSLVFAVPLLKKRATAWLAPGIIIAFTGVALASLQGTTYSWHGLGGKLQANWPFYLLAFIAAVSWALYSDLSRVWAAHAEVSAMPFFLFVSGIVLLGLSRIFPEPAHWTAGTGVLLVITAVGPLLLAYIFWDYGMQKGHLVLLASLSFLIPLTSSITTSLVLRVKVEPILWLACGLVIAGAAICNFAVKDRPVEGSTQPSVESGS